MKTVSDIAAWRQLRGTLKGSVGFVPTMGDLHEGHASLYRRARPENDIVVASIFVNPTQFNQAADYDKYRRRLDDDTKLLESLGVDYLFAPDKAAMYPDDYEVQVTETVVSYELEGAFRPGHFTGMMTVVLKLLNIIAPTRAYLGEKDFQQLLLVKKMAAALFLPVEIIGVETVRALSGLALSSRNARLTPEQLKQAELLPKLLMSDLDDAEITAQLQAAGFRPEYVATQWGRRLTAAWLGDVRLIDNVKKG